MIIKIEATKKQSQSVLSVSPHNPGTRCAALSTTARPAEHTTAMSGDNRYCPTRVSDPGPILVRQTTTRAREDSDDGTNREDAQQR